MWCRSPTVSPSTPRRYERLAEALVSAGYRVVANDHRGHGKSAASANDLGRFGETGFSGVAADIAAFGASVKEANPGLPLFLLAHSMGSFAAQEAILEHSEQYAGVVLSGTTTLDVLGANLAQSEGPVGLEAFNAGFEHRTGYEWLTRDEAEVDKYVADPLSGFDLPDETVPALFAGAAGSPTLRPCRASGSDLPILLTSGQADPISGDGQLIQLLGQRYQDAGRQGRHREALPRGSSRDLQRDQSGRDHRRRHRLARPAPLTTREGADGTMRSAPLVASLLARPRTHTTSGEVSGHCRADELGVVKPGSVAGSGHPDQMRVTDRDDRLGRRSGAVEDVVVSPASSVGGRSRASSSGWRVDRGADGSALDQRTEVAGDALAVARPSR